MVVLGPYGDLDARFAALKAHPAATSKRRGRRRGRSGAAIQAGHGFQAAFGIVFAVVAVGIGVGALGMGAPGPFALIPFVMAGVGVWMAIQGGSKTANFAAAKERSIPALVADERTEVSGGRDRATTTEYFVSLQTEHGRRREYNANSSLAGRLTRGDMGMATVRGDYLMQFVRIDV